MADMLWRRGHEISAGKASREMRVTIPVSALNTGVDAFDNHIRSSDILDAGKIQK